VRSFSAGLPITGDILRGSLLERIVRHTRGCPKCARRRASGLGFDGELSGGRTRQFSLRRERVSEVRRWLDNYQKLKDAIEVICELNHDLLRSDAAAPKPGRKQRD
jgi:hypothetical protein